MSGVAERFAEVNGVRLHYRLAGKGSPVVLLHGYTQTGHITGKQFNGWTALFLVTTVATSVTGFGFPVDHLLPSHIVGIISLLVLAVAIGALYGLHLRGAWRWIYVVCAAVALYLNVFVGVVQAFSRVSALRTLAPQQNEPPFLITQLVVLAVFIALTIVAAKRFRGEPLARA
jgi:pimeloyl-ACP methyl ester carboxylesterase